MDFGANFRLMKTRAPSVFPSPHVCVSVCNGSEGKCHWGSCNRARHTGRNVTQMGLGPKGRAWAGGGQHIPTALSTVNDGRPACRETHRRRLPTFFGGIKNTRIGQRQQRGEERERGQQNLAVRNADIFAATAVKRTKPLDAKGLDDWIWIWIFMWIRCQRP